MDAVPFSTYKIRSLYKLLCTQRILSTKREVSIRHFYPTVKRRGEDQQLLFHEQKVCHSCFTDTALEGHLREFEVDFLAGELLVDRAEGLSLVLDVGLLGLVKVHLEQAGPVQANPTEAHNISVLGAIDHYCIMGSCFHLILLPTISAG